MATTQSQIPVNALRVFDAAARHLSFTQAAHELGVSQAAVSFQIRRLEERLGAPLFLRKVRAIELTEGGERLHRNTRGVFQQLSAAIADVGPSRQRPVTIALTPSFAARWLFPRMNLYRERQPDSELHLVPSIQLHEFTDSRIDVAVRWGKGNWPGLKSEFLMKAPLTPVCSPRLMESGSELKVPADLAAHTLLHERDYEDWRWWMQAADLDESQAERGVVLGDPSLLDSAAIGGEGVASAARPCCIVFSKTVCSYNPSMSFCPHSALITWSTVPAR